MRIARIGVGIAVVVLILSYAGARADERPKPDAPNPEAPKPEAPKPEAPRPEAPRPAAPRETVIAFFQSFSDGNAKGLREALLTDSDDERKVADAMADVAGAVAGARKAAAAKFAIRPQDLKVQVVPVEVFNAMTVKVEDDIATLMQDGEAFIVLKKVNGIWKIALGELLKKGGKNPAQTMTELRGSVLRVEQATADIQSGKFANPAEAAKAVSDAVPARSEGTVQ